MLPSSFLRFHLLGPLGTLGACLLIQSLRGSAFEIPNPPAILLVILVYSSFVGRLSSGLASAFIAWIYIAYFFSNPEQAFTYSEENLRRVIVWGLTIPLISLMVGTLKRRSLRSMRYQLLEKDYSERQSRDERERFHAILNSAYDAFVAMSEDGTVIEWNRQAEMTFGWTREEVMGKHMLHFLIPPRHQGAYKKSLERFLASGESPILNKRIQLSCFHQDGHEIPLEMTVAAIKVPSGFIFTAFLHDISEQQRNEQELRHLYQELELRVRERTQDLHRTEVELRLITNSLPVGIAYIDKNLQFRFCNDTFCEWKGRPRDQILGHSTQEVTEKENHKNLLPYYQSALAGKTVSEELPLKLDSQTRIVSLSIVPDMDENGEVRGIVSLFNDISAHKEIQEQLKQAKEAAEAANEAKSAFLANMSHEIRTPLGAVLGFSELIATEKLTTAEKTSYIEAIHRNGDLLSRIINDILDLSKVEVGKLQVERRAISLHELISDVSTILSLHAKKKNLQLHFKTDPGVPDTIEADPFRLRQILLNVIGNAIKFTKMGRIEVLVSFHQQKLHFVVQDTGLGISAQQAQHLFQPFSQADASTKRKFGGTGLGLVLSRRLAQLMGGDVQLVESILEQGSTFEITVDSGPSISEQVVVPASYQSSLLKKVDLKGLRILLAEDAPDNQVLISRILKFTGASVEVANNGAEAIKKTQSHDYDVILMDLQMPVMDGYEAVQRLRQGGYEKPVVALTAHALKQERDRCLASGFDDHLSKPIDRKALIQALNRYQNLSKDHNYASGPKDF